MDVGWLWLMAAEKNPDPVLTISRDGNKIAENVGTLGVVLQHYLWSRVAAEARSQGVVISGEPIFRDLRAGSLSDETLYR